MPSLNELTKIISRAITKFDRRIPSIQEGVLNEILLQVKGLQLDGNGNIRPTVSNIRLIGRVRLKLQKLVLTPDYMDALTEFMRVFNVVTKTANEVFRGAEVKKNTKKLLKELKAQTIEDTVHSLTEAGIGVNIGDRIGTILRTNITSGSSYKSLTDQLNELLTKTETPGALQRYTKQITTDAVNQYTASFMQNVSGDLGYEWFRYQGRDIDTSRPFCKAMGERPFFHISEVPALLRGEGLTYKEDGKEFNVEVNKRTGLPSGMIEGTDASNFFVRRGGYNCGHQIFPVAEDDVPAKERQRVHATAAYKKWIKVKEVVKSEKTS